MIPFFNEIPKLQSAKNFLPRLHSHGKNIDRKIVHFDDLAGNCTVFSHLEVTAKREIVLVKSLSSSFFISFPFSSSHGLPFESLHASKFSKRGSKLLSAQKSFSRPRDQARASLSLALYYLQSSHWKYHFHLILFMNCQGEAIQALFFSLGFL